MMTQRKDLKRLQFLLPLCLGLVSFYLVVGFRVLDPSNISWLYLGDPAKQYLGWLYYRNAEWQWDFLANPDYGIELATSLVYTDSIPVMALIFKALDPWLPETFQYLGLWRLICFLLQAWFAWKLVGLYTEAPLARLCGAGLLVFSAPMFWRLPGHGSLAAHFLILASLYLLLRPVRKGLWAEWALLLAVSVWVHAYLLAMVLLLWLTQLTALLVRREKPARELGFQFIALLGLTLGLCAASGYFTAGGGISAGGFGQYRMNLLALVDPHKWSFILPDLPNAPREYGGFSFLGTGVILLFLAGAPLLAWKPLISRREVTRHWPMLAAFLALFLFALSHRVGIGALEIELFELGGPLERAANVFRASGRFFWPVFYALVLLSVVLVLRGYRPKAAAGLLGLALLVQAADMSGGEPCFEAAELVGANGEWNAPPGRGGWLCVRAQMQQTPGETWPTPLESPFWREAAARYEQVRRLPPRNFPPHWRTISHYAQSHGMATAAVYLARMNGAALDDLKAESRERLESGDYRADSLYFLSRSSVAAALPALDRRRDLLARIDGFYVIAPGWKACPECSQGHAEVHADALFPPLRPGETLYFSRGEWGPLVLASGWSHPERWGVWSDAAAAEILLPVAGAHPDGVVLAADAFLAPGHPAQRVGISVNGIRAAEIKLTTAAGNRIEFRIPQAARRRIAERGALHLAFDLPDAVRPRDLGAGEDARTLAIGLRSLGLR